MQTFLPYPDFNLSARVLDDKRLGKQRVESMQIYKSCVLDDYGWKQHPAVKMWKGYETALLMYMDTMIHDGSDEVLKVLWDMHVCRQLLLPHG